MTNTWVPHLRNQYKINVHTYLTNRHSNKNTNGVGIVIRDHRGRLVKGLTGSIPDLSPMATQLWAIHMGLNHARKEQLELITLETDNHQAFCEVVRKDGRGDSSTMWIVEQIKKLPSYNSEWMDKVMYVDESANKTAFYLATIGLKHWDFMYHFYEPFGRLQERMDLDMGHGPHFPQLSSSPIPRDIHGYVRGFAPPGAENIPPLVPEIVGSSAGN